MKYNSIPSIVRITGICLFTFAFLMFDMGCKLSSSQISNIDQKSTIPIPISQTSDSVVVDIDGNSYAIIKIGNQMWIGSNLKVSKYNNGTPILPYAGGGFLEPEEKGMFTIYDNDTANENKYGKLYNFHVVAEGCLCPEGWQVPSVEDWQEVINIQKVNELNLLLSGMMNPHGIHPFSDLENAGYWWAATSVGRNTAATYEFHLHKPSLQKSGMNERNFVSVRCIKNIEL